MRVLQRTHNDSQSKVFLVYLGVIPFFGILARTDYLKTAPGLFRGLPCSRKQAGEACVRPKALRITRPAFAAWRKIAELERVCLYRGMRRDDISLYPGTFAEPRCGAFVVFREPAIVGSPTRHTVRPGPGVKIAAGGRLFDQSRRLSLMTRHRPATSPQARDVRRG